MASESIQSNNNEITQPVFDPDYAKYASPEFVPYDQPESENS